MNKITAMFPFGMAAALEKSIAVDAKKMEQRTIPTGEKFLGSIIPKKGHDIWELDLETGDIEKAKVEETTAVMGARGKVGTRKKVIVRKNCKYVSALNRKNALKKFLQMVIVRP